MTAPAPARRSLRQRLLLGVMGAVGGLWLAAALLTWRDAHHELGELLDAHLAQAAALLVAQQVQGHGEDDDDPLLDAPQLHRYARHVAFQVWHEGRLMLRSPNAPTEPLASRREGFETLDRPEGRWRLFATHGAERDVQVYVAERLEARAEILWAVMRGLLGPLLLALPLIGLAVWLAVARGLAPLGQLGRLLAARPPGALEPVALPGGAPAEMRPLLAALNDLLARVGRLISAERRFTADAAHELRTPMAAVRAQAQVALGARDEAERLHALQATLQGCDRASHLVQQLLTLSRLEAAAPLQGQPLDLAALARSVAGELAPAAVAAGQTLSLEVAAPPQGRNPEAAPAPVTVSGDETLLRVLLRNLLDNALRYSGPGARIALRLHQGAGGVLLELDDSGPGLPEAEQARLGERFFRPPGQSAPGSGLGWSIAQRIAQAHGAQLHAGRSATLGGLAVRLHWPARP